MDAHYDNNTMTIEINLTANLAAVVSDNKRILMATATIAKNCCPVNETNVFILHNCAPLSMIQTQKSASAALISTAIDYRYCSK